MHMCAMTHPNGCHDSLICVPWLIQIFVMTHSYLWHDSFIRAMWLVPTCDMTHSYVWHDSFICVTWLIHMFDKTHLYVWHDSSICVTWLMHKCAMTHLYVSHHITHTSVCHDSYIVVTWLIQMCEMTHSDFWHDSFIFVTWIICKCDMTWRHVSLHIIHTSALQVRLHWSVPGEMQARVAHMDESCHTYYEWVMSYIRMSHVALVNESHDKYELISSGVCAGNVRTLNAMPLSHMHESSHTHEWV